MAFSLGDITKAVFKAPTLVPKAVKAVAKAPARIQDTVSENISKLNSLGKQLQASEEYLKGWSGGASPVSSPAGKPQRKPVDSSVKVKLEFLPADQALGYGLGRSMQAVRDGVKSLTGADKVDAARDQAAELEERKRERFEEKLKAQDPERYARYKPAQARAESSILADKNPETQRRRDFRVEESAREKAVLSKDPAAWRSSLEPKARQKFDRRRESDQLKLEHSSSPTAADESALRGRLAEMEKKAVPGKAAWVGGLSPEARAKFSLREARDDGSILRSGMKANAAADVVKDVVTLGANSSQKREGLTGAAKELLTLGIHGLAKSGGEDLGRGQAYLEHAEALNASGAYVEGRVFRVEGEEAQNSGLLSTGMAVVGANSLRPMLRSGVKAVEGRARLEIAKRSKVQRQVETGGLRGETPLTSAQKAEITAFAEELGMPREQVRFCETNTAYSDLMDYLFVGTDVMPSACPKGVGTATVNQRFGWKAAMNHEIVGHRAANLAGKAQVPGSALDEAQASIRAARFGKDLTRLERIRLLRDGVNRLHRDGLKIRDVRDRLWITEQ